MVTATAPAIRDLCPIATDLRVIRVQLGQGFRRQSMLA